VGCRHGRPEIVLFLDTDWRPLRVAHRTRAVTDLFPGKIEFIEYSRDRTSNWRISRFVFTSHL
jgi:hypothetical protein